MIARGFKPVGWVAAVATAALGCYMLSLNVAAERAELAGVEREIVLAKREIRALQTELGTRGRLQQLEHWNADVLALSAPASGQFLRDEFTLASYSEPQKSFEERAQVRMASAEPAVAQPVAKPAVERGFEAAPADLAKPIIHRASLVVGQPARFAPANSAAVEITRQAAAPRIVPVKAAPAKSASAKAAKADLTKAPLVKPAAAKSVAAKTAAPKSPPKIAAKSATKIAGLIDDRLAREIGEAAKAEKSSGGAARR